MAPKGLNATHCVHKITSQMANITKITSQLANAVVITWRLILNEAISMTPGIFAFHFALSISDEVLMQIVS
jgi:hypothetical protein